jgi:hypothetical protein
MRLINLTPIRIRRIKEMIYYLFPEYDSVSLKKSGLIILRKRSFLFFSKKEVLPVTDLMLYELPKRLDVALKAHKIGDMSSINIGSLLEFIIRCKSYNNYFDITDYIWDKFIKLKYKEEQILEAKTVSVPVSIILPLYMRNLYYLKVIIRERFYKEKISTIELIRQKIVSILRNFKAFFEISQPQLAFN